MHDGGDGLLEFIHDCLMERGWVLLELKVHCFLLTVALIHEGNIYTTEETKSRTPTYNIRLQTNNRWMVW